MNKDNVLLSGLIYDYNVHYNISFFIIFCEDLKSKFKLLHVEIIFKLAHC